MALLPFCAAKLRQFFELTKFFLKFFSFSPFFLVFHLFFLVQSCFSAVSIGFSLLFYGFPRFPTAFYYFPMPSHGFLQLSKDLPSLSDGFPHFPTAFHRFSKGFMFSCGSYCHPRGFPRFAVFSWVLAGSRGRPGYVHYGLSVTSPSGVGGVGDSESSVRACLWCTDSAAVPWRVGRFAQMTVGPRLGVGCFAGRGVRRAFYI